jgi:hypothetical protein
MENFPPGPSPENHEIQQGEDGVHTVQGEKRRIIFLRYSVYSVTLS